MNKFEASTAARLEGYGVFSEATIDVVASTAGLLNSKYPSHKPLLRDVGMLDQEYFFHEGTKFGESDHWTHVVDVGPKDAESALIMHRPIGAPLNEENLVDIAVTAMALQVQSEMFSTPDIRVVSFANPGPIGFIIPKYTKFQREDISRGEFKAATEVEARYLEREKIEKVRTEGSSIGAELAVGAAQHDVAEVIDCIVSEPTGIEDRSEALVARDYLLSTHGLGSYVKDTGVIANNTARRASKGWTRWIGGLAKPSNLALIQGIAAGRHQESAEDALRQHPDMKMHYFYGDNSRMTKAWSIRQMVRGMQGQFGEDRVDLTTLEGARHAWPNDLLLHAATIVEVVNKSNV